MGRALDFPGQAALPSSGGSIGRTQSLLGKIQADYARGNRADKYGDCCGDHDSYYFLGVRQTET